MNHHRSGRTRWRLIATLVASLSAAGLAGPAAAAAPAAGDLYVGYYQEDPASNPEDPTMGAIHLRLPAADGSFAGGMDFSYVGCQSESSGSVTGTRRGASLEGAWSGVVDGRPQQGTFAGGWSAALGGYAGTYTVAAGKQHVVVPSCIEYFIAPRGTFELLPIDKGLPAGFSPTVSGSDVRWAPPAGAAMTLVYVLDPELAGEPRGRATRWQTLVLDPRIGAVDLRAARLASGHRYVAVVSVADRALRRLAFASRSFVAP